MSFEGSKILSGAIAKSPGQLFWPTDLRPFRVGAGGADVSSEAQVPSLPSLKLEGVLVEGDPLDRLVKLSLNGLPTPE